MARSLCRSFAIPTAIALSLLPTQAVRGQTTLAERLGYAPDARLLIVHADDIGMTHSVNAASIQLFASGAIRSGSIMVPCPWFVEIASHARHHPDLDLGLHLTLTSEWNQYRWGPVLSPEKVPSLIDEHGFFYSTTEAAAQNINPAEAEAEIRAQVERAFAFGVTPTHLDSHMGVLFQTPALFEAYLRVGRDYNIPVLVPRELIQQAPQLLSLTSPRDIMIDHLQFATPATPADQWESFYTGLIENLAPGVTEIIIHVAHDDAEMRAATSGYTDFGSAWRQRDLDYFTSQKFKDLVQARNVKLITWREIREKLLN